MVATFTIECETLGQLVNHLAIIKTKVVMLDEKELTEDKIHFTDENCYGGHEVTIYPFKEISDDERNG